MEDRFALLIDADNVSAKYIKPILDELSKYGNVTYKRIYGDWTKSNSASWKEELLQNSITPIQQFSYTQGKNSTDSAMIIDAMDMLYTSELEGFCLVSSDSDFTKLASRLRESGKMVIGMGEDKTPLPFRKACDIFTVLEVLLEDNTIEKEESEGKSYHPHVFGRGQKKISGASLSSSNGRGSKEKIEKVSKEKIEEILLTLTEQVAYRLRKQDLLANSVSIQLRTKNFEDFSHQTKLDCSTASTKEIMKKAKQLLTEKFKNGIKLYTQGLVNLFGMFKPLIFDILGIVIGMMVPFIYDRFIKHKNTKLISCINMYNYPFYGLLLASVISINTPIYVFAIVCFVCLFLYKLMKKKYVNVVAVMALIIFIIMNLVGDFSFLNVYEKMNNLHLRPLDYFMGMGSGGINTTNIILLLISVIILFCQDFYKKEITISSFVTYFILIIIYGFIKGDIILVLDSLFSNSVLFTFVFIATDYKTSPITTTGKVIYGILIGIIAFVLYMYYPELAGIGAVLIGSICASKIDKIVER